MADYFTHFSCLLDVGTPYKAARALALFEELRAADQDADDPEVAGFDIVNRPGFTGGQNSRRIAHHGTDIKEEDLEAVFTRVPRTCGAVGDGTPR